VANQRTNEENSKRKERADKILDAAEELIKRWGYSKTTIDDIARYAGVAKGTIYLHWKTRDDLFWALLSREDFRLVESLRRHLTDDLENMTLHTLMRYIVLDTLRSPLAKAMLLMDSEMLGELAKRDYTSASFPKRMASLESFLTYLRDQGTLRADIDIRKQIYMLGAIVMGFLMIDQWMPDDFFYSDEEIADMTAETIRGALEPQGAEQATDKEKQQTIAKAFSSYMEQVITIREQEL
jgi:AcrR family transcriptional regulator